MVRNQLNSKYRGLTSDSIRRLAGRNPHDMFHSSENSTGAIFRRTSSKELGCFPKQYLFPFRSSNYLAATFEFPCLDRSQYTTYLQQSQSKQESGRPVLVLCLAEI